MKIGLYKIKVRTESGNKLGKVSNIIIDDLSSLVSQYEVKNWFGQIYLISREQVLSLNEKEMVVEDSVTKMRDQDNLKDKIKINSEVVVSDGN